MTAHAYLSGGWGEDADKVRALCREHPQAWLGPEHVARELALRDANDHDRTSHPAAEADVLFLTPDDIT